MSPVCFVLLCFWSDELVPAGTFGLGPLLFPNICNKNTPHLQQQLQHSAFYPVGSKNYGTHSWPSESGLRRVSVGLMSLRSPSSDPDVIDA